MEIYSGNLFEGGGEGGLLQLIYPSSNISAALNQTTDIVFLFLPPAQGLTFLRLVSRCRTLQHNCKEPTKSFTAT